MTSEVFKPRRLGAHLLVAPLGEDCLGSVYRAIHGADERRFVRLRVLQSAELSPAAVFSAVARNGFRVSQLSHKAIVQHAELSIADGTPFTAWYETAGWTLNAVLAQLRASGMVLPVSFSLLIAERVLAALEHAWFSPVDGEPVRHGLLWSGLVSISNDAEIRLGGFGLAAAALPTLSRGRLARDIAPYAAPEARDSGVVSPASDSYSAGVLLLELLTCRRPRTTTPDPAFRSDDSFPEGVRHILDRCFSAPASRPTILELHRALQEQLAAAPSPVSTADLALFLYTLLNPESRGMRSPDADSTNPVAAEDGPPALSGVEPFPARRRSDVGPEGTAGSDGGQALDEDEADAAGVLAGDAPFPLALHRTEQTALEAGEGLEAIKAIDAIDAIDSEPEPWAATLQEALSPSKSGGVAAASGATGGAASHRSRRWRWLSGLAWTAAAAAVLVGVETLAARRNRPEDSTVTEAGRGDRAGRADPTADSAASNAPAAPPAVRVALEPSAPSGARPLKAADSSGRPGTAHPAPSGVVRARQTLGTPPAVAPRPAPAERRAALRGARGDAPDAGTARRAAEDARFRAAWARIEAERGEAAELASDGFSEGKAAEAEGDRLLREGDSSKAQEAFERAFGLFRSAESASRSARLNRIRLSSPSF